MTDRDSEGTVEIEFPLEADDVRTLARRVLLLKPRKLAAVILAGAAVTAASLVVGPAVFFDRRDRSLLPYVVSAAVGAGLCVAAFLRGIESQVRIARQVKGLGPRAVTIGPDGVRQAIPGVGDTLRPWTAVEEVRADPIGLLLRVNAVQYLMIPRRAFPDEAAFRRVAELAEAYRAGADGRRPLTELDSHPC